MSDTYTTIHGIQALVCAPDGAQLKSENDALDLIGEAMRQDSELITVPVERLHEDFNKVWFVTSLQKLDERLKRTE